MERIKEFLKTTKIFFGVLVMAMTIAAKWLYAVLFKKKVPLVLCWVIIIALIPLNCIIVTVLSLMNLFKIKNFDEEAVEIIDGLGEMAEEIKEKNMEE